MPRDRLGELERVLGALTGRPEQAAVETVRRHRDGSELPVSCRLSPLIDTHGFVYGASAVVRPMQREFALRRHLERTRQEAQARFTHSAVAQLTADPGGTIMSVNRAMCRLTGWEDEKAALGRSLLDLIPAEDVEATMAVLDRLASGRTDFDRHQRRLFHADGHLLDTQVTVYGVHDIDGSVSRLEAVFDDISDELAVQRALQQSEEKWRHLARHSADVALLCDAGGRVGFVSAAVTHRFGHHTQDVLGADCFAFVHPDDEPHVRQRWERTVAEPGTSTTFQTRIRAANGQWRWTQETVTNSLEVIGVEAMVVNLVDITGRESVTPAALAVADDLRRGILAEELIVQFQPIISLTSGAVTGAEALVRWQHPEQGLLSPVAFIDAAESSGLIVELGKLVLAAACDAAARWAKLGSRRRPFHVGVNLSAVQLSTPGVVDTVRAQLSRSGAQAHNLMLEVTESAVMGDVAAATATLQELRELGVAIAVDDFGTGYSSLTYLKKFPITEVKIDRSFVAGLGVDDDDAAIVASVISLARALNVGCIAEGVETHRQRRALQALGCEAAQGFRWSPAIGLDAFDAFVAGHDPATVLATGPVELANRPPRRRLAPTSPTAKARILALHSAGASLATIAAALNTENLTTAEDKRWHARSVARVIAELAHG
jgi:PAS domain S-box-containing protein